MRKTLYKLTTLILFVVSFIFMFIVQASAVEFTKGETKVSGSLGVGVTYENFLATSIKDGSSTISNQNVSYVKALNNSNVRVVSWASYNKDGIVGKTVEALCKDYEAKNPGYKV